MGCTLEGLGLDMTFEAGEQIGRALKEYTGLGTEVPMSVVEVPSKQCTDVGSRNCQNRLVVASQI